MDRGVLFGRKPRVMFEIVNEMGLVVKTAVERYMTPFDRMVPIDRRDSFLKSHDLQIGLGSNTDLLSEHRREMLLRVADL